MLTNPNLRIAFVSSSNVDPVCSAVPVLGPEDEAAGGRRPGEAARLADTCEAVVVLVTCSYSAAMELVLSVALASKVSIYTLSLFPCF